MPNYGYEWEKMYPDGFVTYGTRHLPKVMHNRMEVLGTFLKMSTEMVMVKSLEIGIESLEMELKKLAEENGERDNKSG